LAVLGCLYGCSGGGGGTPVQSTAPTTPPQSGSGLSPAAALGEQIFGDKSLSASGQMSCATCHDPKANYGPPNNLAVQLGGPSLATPGFRAVPSLEYKERTPGYHQDPDLDGGVPSGGFMWDGRVNTLQAQPALPLLSPFEMDNASAADVAAKVQNAAYATDFAKLFGAGIFSDPETALEKVGYALSAYILEDSADFYPFNSKYDYYLAGKVSLSAQEMRGLADFENSAVGCSGCHLDKIGADGLAGSSPVFTDYQFEAVGVPRNPNIPANSDPAYFDLGICGPLRTDQSLQAQYCGLFKTPTLRNVAKRPVFFHNGFFTSLSDALHFYVERDTNPALWYPSNPDGSVDKFNDLPPQYLGNVDVIDPPFDRSLGQAPALADADIEDLIAFLQTLNDGYQLPAQ
jgi:cytochrome c peroxidase